MRKVVLCLTIFLSLILSQARAQIVQAPDREKLPIREYVKSKKIPYLYETIENESHFTHEVGDTYLTCPRTDKSIRARGIPQITDCYHPEITDEQANDDYWAVDWMAQMFREGKQCEWTAYKNFTGLCR